MDLIELVWIKSLRVYIQPSSTCRNLVSGLCLHLLLLLLLLLVLLLVHALRTIRLRLLLPVSFVQLLMRLLYSVVEVRVVVVVVHLVLRLMMLFLQSGTHRVKNELQVCRLLTGPTLLMLDAARRRLSGQIVDRVAL